MTINHIVICFVEIYEHVNSKLITDYLVTIYNTSLFSKLYTIFTTESGNKKLNYMKNMAYFIKNSELTRPKIKSLIMLEIIFLRLPIKLYPYNRNYNNLYVLIYIIKLLDEESNIHINKKFVYESIFGANYIKDTNNETCKTYLNVLPQCRVNYLHNNARIAHATCAESTLLNILKTILMRDDNIIMENVDEYIKPVTDMNIKLRYFFSQMNTMKKLRTKEACTSFTQIVSNIDGINYLKEVDDYKYDLDPNFNNVMKLFFYIINGKFTDDSIGEYRDRLKDILHATVEETDDDSTKRIMTLENITCTFTQHHAYVGRSQFAPGEELEYTASLYLTLYFNKYAPLLVEQISNTISNKPEVLYPAKQTPEELFIKNLTEVILNVNMFLMDVDKLINVIPKNARTYLFKEITGRINSIPVNKTTELSVILDKDYLKNYQLVSVFDSKIVYVNTLYYFFFQNYTESFFDKIQDWIYEHYGDKDILFNTYLLLQKILKTNIDDISNFFQLKSFSKNTTENTTLILIYNTIMKNLDYWTHNKFKIYMDIVLKYLQLSDEVKRDLYNLNTSTVLKILNILADVKPVFYMFYVLNSEFNMNLDFDEIFHVYPELKQPEKFYYDIYLSDELKEIFAKDYIIKHFNDISGKNIVSSVHWLDKTLYEWELGKI